jgi:hypothetical protein
MELTDVESIASRGQLHVGTVLGKKKWGLHFLVGRTSRRQSAYGFNK